MQEVSPMGWALQPLKRYADFSGRSPRAEYWWWLLFQVLAFWTPLMVIFVGSIVLDDRSAIAGDGALPAGPGFWIMMILFLAGVLGLFIPNLAVQIRRLHDQNLSGWFILLFFVPYIGGLLAIIFMCISGTKGPNRFGPDPYGRDAYEQIFA